MAGLENKDDFGEVLLVGMRDFICQDLRNTLHSDRLFKAHLSFTTLLRPPPSPPSRAVTLPRKMDHLVLLAAVVPNSGVPKTATKY